MTDHEPDPLEKLFKANDKFFDVLFGAGKAAIGFIALTLLIGGTLVLLAEGFELLAAAFPALAFLVVCWLIFPK